MPEGRGKEGQEVVHGRRPLAVASEALRDVILDPDVHAHVPVVQRCVDIRGKFDIQDVHTDDFVPLWRAFTIRVLWVNIVRRADLFVPVEAQPAGDRGTRLEQESCVVEVAVEHTRQVRIEELVAHRARGKLVRVTVLDGEEGRTDRKNTDASDGVCRVLEALKDWAGHVLVLVPLLDPADEVAILEEDAERVLLAVESVAEELDGVRQFLNLHTVLSVCQIFPFLAAVEVIPSHGLHPQRQQHRVSRDLQIVAIEVVYHSADVAEAQIGEDERSDELLLRLARRKEHDQVADARHGEDV